jgi:hypothetical protein
MSKTKTKAGKRPLALILEPLKRDLKRDYASMMARLSATLDLKGLSDRERAFLATCQKLDRRWNGSNNPFEDFFHNLVASVWRDSWPTPDDVAQELDEFRKNFDDMRRDAASFLEAYPLDSVAEAEQAKEAAHA